jgi:ribosome biogenesis GTPase
MIDLALLGWNDFFAAELAALARPDLEPGRVAGEDRHRYDVYTQSGVVQAEVTGRLLYLVDTPADLPKVGDWVALVTLDDGERAFIQSVLGRRSKLSRKVPGRKSDEQILAANLDVLFIVQGLDDDYSPRRLERYLAMAFEDEVRPIIVLNKTDVCLDVEARVAEIERIAAGVPVLAVSAEREGVDALRRYLQPGMTFALVGSSGVGKSTIINKLAGEELQDTYEVNPKGSEGRHITTRRELILLPDGTVLIDTPGMRELQLLLAEQGLSDSFSDIELLATHCRFADCTHESEPNCAVRAAIAAGELDRGRLRNYQKLQREQAAIEARQDKSAYLARKEQVKAFSKRVKKMISENPKLRKNA